MSTDIEEVLRDAVAWQRDQAPAAPGLLEDARSRRARRQRWTVVSAAAATVVVTAAVVIPVATLADHGSSPKPSTPPVTAVQSCSAATLAATFGETGIGAGSVRGVITLFNATARPCALDADATVVPLDSAGAAIRTPSPLVAAAASPPLVLRGLAGGLRGSAPHEVGSAAIPIGGAVADVQGRMCPTGKAVAPATWRITLGDAQLTVANTAPAGTAVPTLTACKARFSVGPQHGTGARAASVGATPSPCSSEFAVQLVSDRDGQPTPLAAAQWFVVHGGPAGRLPLSGWHVVSIARHEAVLASGASTLHAIQGPDATWQIDSGHGCG